MSLHLLLSSDEISMDAKQIMYILFMRWSEKSVIHDQRILIRRDKKR